MVDIEHQEYRDVVHDTPDLYRRVQARGQFRTDESQQGLWTDSSDGDSDNFPDPIGDLACVRTHVQHSTASHPNLYNRISIPVIFGLAKETNLVRHDPVLWFSMMLMPGSPPAMMISGLAELANASESERMTIAKMLTVSVHFSL